ncbi:H-NS histone family protein [Acidicapsa acidisoli]|uniref:H-NS histone family protein n=1 Tax=Acidicapsa acidisoli TaxID=1615681 RepID=UPI0021DFFB71|nr:H-NS histone family protein [Acidicapsa acidisoli]
MIKADMFDGFNDDDLREVKTLADKLLKNRDDNRKDKALEQARATLAAVGLTLKDLGKAKTKAAKGPQYKGGHVYQHPTNKTLVWKAKGQKPGWLRELESEDKKAVEIGL